MNTLIMPKMKKVKVSFTLELTERDMEALKEYMKDCGAGDETVKEFLTSNAEAYMDQSFIPERILPYID